MPAHKPSAQPAPKDDPLTTDVVLRVARGIKTVRSNLLATVLRVLPWLALIVALVILFFGDRVGVPGPQIFGTGVITVVIVLFAFQVLLTRVPQTMAALWRRKLIVVRPKQIDEDLGPDEKQSSPSDENANAYVAYVNEFESLLNNQKGQWAMSSLLNYW